MKNFLSTVVLGFTLPFLCEASFAQEWVKSGAARSDYVQDRVACAQEAQSMALAGEAFDKDVTECLASKGWQRNLSNQSMPVYCADQEAAISCKPGGTEEMYKKDRAECTDQMLKTIGARYSRPGWWGLGGLIVSAIQAEQDKTNLSKAQYQTVRICLEGRNWTVEWKGEVLALMGPSRSVNSRPNQQPGSVPVASGPAPYPNSASLPPTAVSEVSNDGTGMASGSTQPYGPSPPEQYRADAAPQVLPTLPQAGVADGNGGKPAMTTLLPTTAPDQAAGPATSIPPTANLSPSPTTVATTKGRVAPRPTKNQMNAERLATAKGCPSPAATRTLAGIGGEIFEQFNVTCGSRDPLPVRCDRYGCRLFN